MARIPLLGTLSCILGPVLGIFLNVLGNLKYSFDILHECLDIIMVIDKLKNVLGSLYFEHFWVFLVRFVVCSSTSREPSNIFICIFFIFLFRDIK